MSYLGSSKALPLIVPNAFLSVFPLSPLPFILPNSYHPQTPFLEPPLPNALPIPLFCPLQPSSFCSHHLTVLKSLCPLHLNSFTPHRHPMQACPFSTPSPVPWGPLIHPSALSGGPPSPSPSPPSSLEALNSPHYPCLQPHPWSLPEEVSQVTLGGMGLGGAEGIFPLRPGGSHGPGGGWGHLCPTYSPIKVQCRPLLCSPSLGTPGRKWRS